VKIKIDPLDALFSRYIRTRDGWTCQRCKKKYAPPTRALHCSHFHGRRKKSVRWDPENCTALCYGCHAHFTGNPELHRIWFRNRIGETAFDLLMLRANIPKKPDKEMIKLWLTAKLKELEKP